MPSNLAERVEADGRVWIFDLSAGAWQRRHVVDAREALKAGTATLDGANDPWKAETLTRLNSELQKVDGPREKLVARIAELEA